ncbi:MAG: methyltransferase domain-containing protein [Verrucomicrobiota bacterium]
MSNPIHAIYGLIFKVWRRKRFRLFVEVMAPAPDDLLLDVGGYPQFWMSNPQPVKRIDSLNIHPVEWDSAAHPDYQIRTVIGNGCALEMADKSYDIVFSNSVIEHVGSWEQQQAFAAEIRRVGKALWIQTPAYECPIEPHYLAPFVHYLPPSVQRRILRWCSPWGLITKPA